MKKTKIFALIMSVFMLLSLAACGVDITSIGLPDELTLDKGGTEQLTVSYGTEDEATEEMIAEAAAKLTLVWTSSNESVATVSETGLVTAVAAGEADITVSIDGANVQSVCHVTVKVPLVGVEAPESLALVINGEDSATIETTVNPDDATGVTVKFVSSDEAVATVDASGKVIAVGAGECVVTTTATADGKEVTAETAVKVDVAPISLSLEDATLTIGYGGSLEVVIEGEDLTIGETFTWVSSDESIVTVDEEGNIKGTGIGTATVTVTNEIGQSATSTVTVKNIVCAYCGQEGHGSGSCQKKKDDEAAAAARAAQEAAAAQAAQAAGGGAGGGSDGGGSSGGGSSGGGGGFEAVPGGSQTIPGGGVGGGAENGVLCP